MQSIRQVERLNQAELEKCVPPNGSWHTDYRDTAYVYIGGLPFELSEGDVLTIFSQYGNPVHVNLIRDKETGKSKGFAFLKYEDQRSCDLAVDNLSGAGVLGRVLSVDHTRYKLKEGEIEGEGMEEEQAVEDDDTDREGESRRKRRRTSSVSEPRRPALKEEVDLAQLRQDHDDDDPMKKYLIKEKQEEVAEALKRAAIKDDDQHERIHKARHHRSRRDLEDDERRRDRHRHERSQSRERRDHKSSRRHRSRDGDRRRRYSSDEDRVRQKPDDRSPPRRRSRSRSQERRRRRERDRDRS